MATICGSNSLEWLDHHISQALELAALGSAQEAIDCLEAALITEAEQLMQDASPTGHKANCTEVAMSRSTSSSSSTSSVSSSSACPSASERFCSVTRDQRAQAEEEEEEELGKPMKPLLCKRGDAYLLLAQLHLIRDMTKAAIEASQQADQSFGAAGWRLGRLEALLLLSAAATKDAQQSARSAAHHGRERLHTEPAGAASKFLAVRAAKEAQAAAATLTSKSSITKSAATAASAAAEGQADQHGHCHALQGAAHFAIARGHALNEQLDQAFRAMRWAIDSFQKSGDLVSQAYATFLSAQLELEFGADPSNKEANIAINQARSLVEKCSEREQQALREVLDFLTQRLQGNDSAQIGDWYTEAAFVMIERHAREANAAAPPGTHHQRRSGLGHRHLVEQQFQHEQWLLQLHERQQQEEHERHHQQQQQQQQVQQQTKEVLQQLLPSDKLRPSSSSATPPCSNTNNNNNNNNNNNSTDCSNSNRFYSHCTNHLLQPTGYDDDDDLPHISGDLADCSTATTMTIGSGNIFTIDSRSHMVNTAAQPEVKAGSSQQARPKLTLEEARSLAKQYRKGAKVRLSNDFLTSKGRSILESSDIGEVLSCRILDGTVEVFLRAPSRKTDTFDASDLELVTTAAAV